MDPLRHIRPAQTFAVARQLRRAATPAQRYAWSPVPLRGSIVDFFCVAGPVGPSRVIRMRDEGTLRSPAQSRADGRWPLGRRLALRSSCFGVSGDTSPIVAHSGARRSRLMRTRLCAVPTRRAYNSVRATPQKRVLRKPPVVFVHPKTSSTRCRQRWLTAKLACRVVRPSFARRRARRCPSPGSLQDRRTGRDGSPSARAPQNRASPPSSPRGARAALRDPSCSEHVWLLRRSP